MEASSSSAAPQRVGGRRLWPRAFFLCSAVVLLLALLPGFLYRLERTVVYQGRGVDVPTSLHGQIALITGSSQGIGFHSAREFCRRGAHVLVTGRTREKTERAASEVAANARGLASALQLDLANYGDVRRFVREVAENYPPLNVLVLNAGMSYGPKIKGKNTSTASGHDLLYASNYLGHFLLVQLLRSRLAKGATVVSVGSASMWTGTFSMLMKANPRYDLWTAKMGPRPAYANSKLALHCYMKALRRRLEPEGLRALNMAPGHVATSILHDQDLSCKRRLLWHWCGPPEVSGRLVLESSFLTLSPLPDMIYPYAFPRVIYERYGKMSQESERRRSGMLFGYPSYLERLTFGTLHVSVGPECDLGMQERLWKWSANVTGVAA